MYEYYVIFKSAISSLNFIATAQQDAYASIVTRSYEYFAYYANGACLNTCSSTIEAIIDFTSKFKGVRCNGNIVG